jgi:hypothetical protein
MKELAIGAIKCIPGYSVLYTFLDLELASEDDPMSGSANGRGGGTHPVRKRINIKLRPSSKSRNGAAAAGSSSGKKAGKTSKSGHDASGNERVLVEVPASNEPSFGMYYTVFHCLVYSALAIQLFD